MEVNEQELVSTFLEITMSNCRDSASNILKDARWNMEVAIQLFFEGDGSHREPIGLPFNSIFNFDSIIVPIGWGSEDEKEVDDGQKHFDFDATGQPTGWGLEDEVEVVEFQEHDDIEHSGWGSDDEEEVDDGQNHFCFDATSQPTVWCMEDENEVEEGQEYLDLDSNIVPTGWGLEDEVEVEFQKHDTEHRSESNAGTTEDSDWKEEGFNETNLSMLYRRPICLMFHGQFHEAKVEASYRDRWLLVNVQASEQFNSHLDLMRFSDRSPKQHLLGSTRRESANASTYQTVANEASQPKEASPVSTTKPSYPPLPEEPIDKKLICKVGICLPSGKRVQRSFHKTDSTKLLWSFCSTLLKEEVASKSFCFIVPASTKLIYDDERSFAEAGLSNSLLRLSLGGDN